MGVGTAFDTTAINKTIPKIMISLRTIDLTLVMVGADTLPDKT